MYVCIYVSKMNQLKLLQDTFFSVSSSVPSFHGLQDDILSKLADVLEEVSARFKSASAPVYILIHWYISLT